MSTKTDTNPTFERLEAGLRPLILPTHKDMERLKDANRELRAIVAVLVRRMGGKAEVDTGIMLEVYGLTVQISRSEDGRSIEISV